MQEISSINDALQLGYSISYWRTSNNVEVDLVLYGRRGLKAFEIKRTRRVSKSMLNGLRIFLKDYPMTQAYFVYGGDREMREGDIRIVPMGRIFKGLPTIL